MTVRAVLPLLTAEGGTLVFYEDVTKVTITWPDAKRIQTMFPAPPSRNARLVVRQTP